MDKEEIKRIARMILYPPRMIIYSSGIWHDDVYVTMTLYALPAGQVVITTANGLVTDIF